ncbi:MAG TPA: DMT family transporter [Anaeromyxobacteraceae bacterium]|nr:DMT family transporter [Anaeromyxobacteraceae bacterium]
MSDPVSRKPWAAFGVMCAVFATTFLAIRIGVRDGASPFLFAGLRFTVAGALLLGVLALRGRVAWSDVKRLSPRAFAVSLPLTSLTFGAMYWAEARIDSGLMSRLEALGPVVTALLARALLGSRLPRIAWLGLGLGVAGGVLLAGTAQGGLVAPAGLGLALVSVVAYAAGLVLYDRLFGPEDDPVTVSALQSLLGGLALLAAAPLLERTVWPPTAAAWWALAYLTLAGSILGHSLSLVVVRDAGSVFASSWLYVSPPIATVLGAVILSERFGTAELLGTGLALSGVYLVTRRLRRVPEASLTAETSGRRRASVEPILTAQVARGDGRSARTRPRHQERR